MTKIEPDIGGRDIQIPADWTFKNRSVAEGFDRHVREQLPWYELVTHAVAHIARHYLPSNGRMYDIGASTGNIGNALRDSLDARRATLIGIEPSQEMAAVYDAPGELLNLSALDVAYEPFDVAVCMLVLMFLTETERKELIRKLRLHIKPGGAIIIVDKVEAHSGYMGTVMHRLTLAGKVASGVSPKEIIDKELSLSGMQRPLRDAELPTDAQAWFRFGEFAGWVIEAK